jgi:RNA polymerase sigma-70 factor (ECF subfamily)
VTICAPVELRSVSSPELPPDKRSDAAVVACVLQGDREAFALLVERHHARCLRVASQLLGSSDDADDVVQDAFIRAFRHLGSYREQDKFGSWVMRIVVNQCRTRLAKDARWVPLEVAHDGSDPTHDVSGADALARVERRAEMAQALALLSPAEREVLVLKYSEELGYGEIAALTGASVPALKMRVSRACARLRALLLPQHTR